MRHEILAELCADPWVMEPRALEAFLARLQSSAEPAAAHDERPRALFEDDEDGEPDRVTVRDGVATVPISGVLIQRARVARMLRAWYGMDVTAYSEIQDDLSRAAATPGVHTIRLAVESPGGQVAGGLQAADAIHSTRGRKRVVAETHSVMASGAYWLASQAHEIVAGPNAIVGSIGVYSAIVDSEKLAADIGLKVHLIASGPHKGAGMFGVKVTDEQIAGLRSIIDGLAANFRGDVARGRGVSAEKAASWATGQTWLGAEACGMGLVDRVERDPSKAINTPPGVPAAAAITTHEGDDMSAEALAAAEAKGRQDAQTAERKRYEDLKTAFPDDAAFALEQWQKGASVEQAKVAHNAVLQQRLADARREKAELEARIAAGGETTAPAGGQRSEAPATPKDALSAQRALVAAAQADQASHIRSCANAARQPAQKHPCCAFGPAMVRARAAHPELLQVTATELAAKGVR